MSSNPKKQNIASIPDRIRGGICALLMIASMTMANLTTSSQWQITFIVFGMLMFLTTFSMVFENYQPGMDEEEDDGSPPRSKEK